jgi:hypothetical protein
MSDEWWWTQAESDTYHTNKDYTDSILTQVNNAWTVGNPSPISSWFSLADSAMAQGSMMQGMGMYAMAKTKFESAKFYYDSVSALWTQLNQALLFLNDMAEMHLIGIPFEELE